MKTGQARGIAEDWVRENASPEDWFLGAYFSGSIIELSDYDELPIGSDADLVYLNTF
ncbi:hypothetical protein [Fictibacillus terranigra]|uniref:Uncharacterized protein n=1 Tax=Fictibacillus terranigra TaxID=3058424 RepID=A0ABT8E2D6_9BACL|nr:hypothetical protein [Fictibacillus sp. CENA-BCM004]MDN4072078.1 hypothetical protein [Fictibacillus sp. CENA-BCM004]